MKRERNFKVYLNNPSMRAALFAPMRADDAAKIGHLAECAIFSQWQHAQGFRNLRYARWKNEGEVDIVYLAGGAQKPLWVGEIKWSDRIRSKRFEELRNLRVLLENFTSITGGFITTKTISDTINLAGRRIDVVPSALYCYTVGRNIAARLDNV